MVITRSHRIQLVDVFAGEKEHPVRRLYAVLSLRVAAADAVRATIPPHWRATLASRWLSLDQDAALAMRAGEVREIPRTWSVAPLR